jgi:pantetheine-phosphate adenylyltransferase
MSPRTALFPGTFDPVTHGHVDLVRRGRALFDEVVVAVVADTTRATLGIEQRLALLREVLAEGGLDEAGGVRVVPFHGLVVEAARAHGAACLLRGIRGALDWEYEMRMAYANRELAAEVDTVFLPPSPGLGQISGSLVREVARLGGDISSWVHPRAARALVAAQAPGGPAAGR